MRGYFPRRNWATQSQIISAQVPGSDGARPVNSAFQVERKDSRGGEAEFFTSFQNRLPENDPAIPGVTVAFSYGHLTALDPGIEHLLERREAAVMAAVLSDVFALGSPLPVLLEVIDTTPLIPVQKYVGQPEANWKARRARAQWGAGEWTVRPVFPAILPATSYGADSCELLSEIQRHMLEPVIDGGLTWSPMWTADEIRGYLNNRLTRFLMETGLLVQRVTIPAVAGTSIYDYPSDLIESRRVAWNDGASVGVLPRTDHFALDFGSPGWSATPGTPTAVVEEPRVPLSIQLAPTPSANGTIDLLYLADPPTITAACVPLPIPCAFAWAVKYGVMADMLNKEGEAQDQERAGFCEQRFQEGVELARLFNNSKREQE